jgi:DNA-directed RNA polymerase beta subunit
MGAKTLTDAKRPTGESDQETDEVGSSVTGSASHRSVADSAAAIVITPPWPNECRQLFDGLGWISQESGHRHIVCATPGGIMRQFITSSMRNLHPISNAKRA